MKFSEYEIVAATTAIYPNRGQNLPYAVLGLVEETGEVVEKIDNLDKLGLCKELGDQVWYVVAICFELKLPFEQLEIEVKKLQIKKNQPLLQIMEECIGRISSYTKKAMRDNNGIVHSDKQLLFVKDLGLILSAISTLSENHGFSLTEVFVNNHKKLQDRLQRNTIQGSGDDR